MSLDYEADRGLQDPDEVLDWSRSWAEWLPEGDTIEDSVWTVEGVDEDDEDPLEVITDAGFEATFDDTTATVWLRHGTPGTEYRVQNRITTAGGRVKDETFIIEVRAA
jgi:hypothetical protein